jgi:hypothetical protein
MSPSGDGPRGHSDSAPGTIDWPVQVDAGMVATLMLASIAMLVAPVAIYLDPEARQHTLWVAMLTLATLALVVAFMVPTRYTITLDALEIRAGILRSRIAWRDVVRLEMSNSWVSSNTWTFRRVMLVTAAGRLVPVGPQDRLAFCVEVLARAPHLQPDPKLPQRGWFDPTRDGPLWRRVLRGR